jgi:hypothetical protein
MTGMCVFTAMIRLLVRLHDSRRVCAVLRVPVMVPVLPAGGASQPTERTVTHITHTAQPTPTVELGAVPVGCVGLALGRRCCPSDLSSDALMDALAVYVLSQHRVLFQLYATQKAKQSPTRSISIAISYRVPYQRRERRGPDYRYSTTLRYTR